MNNAQTSTINEKSERRGSDSGNYRKISLSNLKMPPHAGVNPPGSPKPTKALMTTKQIAMYYEQFRPKR